MNQILFLFVLASILGLISANTYYVTPVESILPCPEQEVPCFTLSHYATRPSTFFENRSKLAFLPGDHILNTELRIGNLTALTLSAHSDPPIAITITCTDGAKFVFEHVGLVAMKGLKLYRCFNNKVILVDDFTIEDSNLYGGNETGSGLELDRITNGIIATSSFSWFNGNSLGNTENLQLFGALIVVNSDNVTILSCTFVNNTLTGYYGGGAALIILFTSTVTVNDSTFVNNVLYGDEQQLGGGAMVVGYSTLVMHHSNFSANAVICNEGLGGGAMVGLFSNISLHSCNFIDNLLVMETSSDVDNDGGGALYFNFGSSISVIQCAFVNNSVVGYDDQYAGGGGAMFAVDCTIIMDACRFTDNKMTGANAEGGALYFSNSFVTLNDSFFDNNVVTGNFSIGGGIMSNLNVETITINGCTFTNNLASGEEANGGALAALDGSSYIMNSTFSSNVVSASDGALGGAVLALSTNLSIEATVFIHNTITGKVAFGGAIQYSGDVDIKMFYYSIYITGCVFHNNSINVVQTEQLVDIASLINSSGILYSLPSLSALTNGKVSATLAIGGAVAIESSTTTIVHNTTFTNNLIIGSNYLDLTYGGAAFIQSGVVVVNNSNFTGNSVISANAACGAVYFGNAVLFVYKTTFNNNTVNSTVQAYVDPTFGGAIYIEKCNANLSRCIFINNQVVGHSNNAFGLGGAVLVRLSHVVFASCKFIHNIISAALGSGGALCVTGGSLTVISKNSFVRNKVNGTDAAFGGAVSFLYTNATLTLSTFSCNSVNGKVGFGGGISHTISGELNLDNCTFTSNVASGEGGALGLQGVVFTTSGYISIQNNVARTGALHLTQCLSLLSGKIDIVNNIGSLFVMSGRVIALDTELSIVSNSRSNEGGAISLVQTAALFAGNIKLTNNSAKHGGAIFATDTTAEFLGDISVSHNKASLSGGGFYADRCNIFIVGSMNISSNFANFKGGGIHAIGSFLRLVNGSKLLLGENAAEKGGGIYLELNAKIYIIKIPTECTLNSTLFCQDVSLQAKLDKTSNCSEICVNNTEMWIQLQLTNNIAQYGGAVYIGDETYSIGACYSIPFEDVLINDPSECFVQSLGGYYSLDLPLTLSTSLLTNVIRELVHSVNFRNTFVTGNIATKRGNILYGGLLDRCKVSPLAEILKKYSLDDVPVTADTLNAVSYILNITDITLQDFNSTEMISSDPVRVCFCDDNKPDCSFHPQPKYVNKGAQFRVSLVAVDQINNTIPNTIIHASVSLPATLGKGQTTQQTNIDGKCTQLTYSIFSQNSSEALYLYAEGPCAGIGISTRSINVSIAPCPVGFIDANTSCECDPDIYPEYIVDCFIDSESVLRRDTAWFTFVNDTDFQGYVLHHHCPFDYCLPPSELTLVNLTDPNGADVICALNRSRILCGSCKDGLSQTFGGSRCLKCSNNMLSLLIVFAIAGIALVAFLLLCNFTVAVGTTNSLIFYANIFAANRAIFSPFEPNALTIFIAWLNLDFGFESCFYDGMDTYTKTWLQLAFPLYVITLVILIIVISDYSQKFAALFHGRNPIATLATLILLSYTKLLRIIITSLSSAKLQYSDGTDNTVWLADGNVPYFSGKHIPLFTLALMIVMVGVLFTSLVFSWQWLVYCSNRDPWKRIVRNPKVFAFIDAYHNPFNKQHRYWIGLLLFVRVVLYLVSIINVLGDPRINLLSINSTVVVLLFLRHAVGYKHKIHKTWLTSMFESIAFANLIGLSSVTFYITDNTDSQALVTTISTAVCFATFFAMMVYHAYHFMLKRPFYKFKHFFLRICNCYHTETDNIPLTSEDFGHPTETGFDALPVALHTDEIVSESDHDTSKYEEISSQKEFETLSTVSATNGDTPSVDFNETPNEDCIVQPVKDTVPPTTSPTVEIEMQSLTSGTNYSAKGNDSVVLFEETKSCDSILNTCIHESSFCNNGDETFTFTS